MSVLLLTATALEQTRLAEALTGVVSLSVYGRTWRHGVCAGRDVNLVETGLGAVNTAHAVTRCLEAQRPDMVMQVGVAGAYAGSGLRVGDLAVAAEEVYGDLGVVTPDGKKLYIALSGSNQVAVIDTRSRKLVTLIDDVGEEPWGATMVGALNYCH